MFILIKTQLKLLGVIIFFILFSFDCAAQQEFTPGEFRSPKQAGVGNAVLFYTYRHNIPDSIHIADALNPYVGYWKDGAFQDWYFDTFVFTTIFHPGLKGFPFDMTYDGWMKYSELVFDRYYEPLKEHWRDTSEGLVPLLEKKVEEVGAELKDDATKRGVIFMIPYNEIGHEHIPPSFFNKKLNVTYDLKTTDGTFDLIKWYIDYMVEKWNTLNPKRLVLKGFYWAHEGIPPDSIKEVETVARVSDYLHNKNLSFYFSPYIRMGTIPPSVDATDETLRRFDCVWVQPGFWSPGYYSPKNTLADSVRLKAAADLATRMNFGINMEWHGNENSTYFRYISYGYQSGFVQASHLFYEENGKVWVSANSSISGLRRQYDDTYQFIKYSR
ncbi:MAG: DUF4855 domain-containing protein [Bacteroidota bacterium]